METLLRAMGEVVPIATVDARKMNGRTTRTHIDLFSGIGGFALACRWAGIETIAFCEIEKYAQRVLRKNFPGIRIFEDVRQFPATEFREPFLLTGGYPCQPFSLAGKRRGTEDDRHLWPSMFKIIRTSRPTWILAENVAGHVTLGLDEVLADLEGRLRRPTDYYSSLRRGCPAPTRSSLDSGQRQEKAEWEIMRT